MQIMRSLLVVACLISIAACSRPIGTPLPTTRDGAVVDGTHAKLSKYAVVYGFNLTGTGNDPLAGPVAANGVLFGTASKGGSHRGGIVYSLTPSGDFKVLHEFGSGNDGALPAAPMTLFEGRLYGTTKAGGEHEGTAFEITLSGNERVLHRFGAPRDGARPSEALTLHNGEFFSTTTVGGCVGCRGMGTVYALSRTGAERVLLAFDCGTPGDGCLPESTLVPVHGML